jgi:glucokinase
LAQQLLGASDPTPVIVNAALRHEDQPCELCLATLNLFVSILGAEAGNLALKVMATGGLYLAGGIPRRILPALEHQRFLKSFLDKGRLTKVLISTPVHVVTNPDVAILGSARYASEL